MYGIWPGVSHVGSTYTNNSRDKNGSNQYNVYGMHIGIF